MSLKFRTKADQLEIAKTTTCSIELKDLHTSQYMNVRRAVARNRNITKDIANRLSIDPVLNVSYMALQNPKSTINRNLCEKSITNCVLCEDDERTLDCIGCEDNQTIL